MRVLALGLLAGALAAIVSPQIQSALNEIASYNSSDACGSCTNMVKVLKDVALNDSTILSTVLEKLCVNVTDADISGTLCGSIHFYPGENGTFGVYSYLDTLINVLTLMDPESDDSRWFCNRMWGQACSQPALNAFNSSEWWPSKDQVYRAPLPTSKNSTFDVLHISDIHLSMNYSESASAHCSQSMCCIPQLPQNPTLPPLNSPKWGYYNCDSPRSLMESALQDVMKRNGNYDFALFTGDMVDHNPVFVDYNSTLYEEEQVLKAFKNDLGDIPVYPVLGNHDSYPYGQEPPLNSQFANATAFNYADLEPLWRDWLGPNATVEARTMHGAYSVMAKPGLKVITLNSNYWYQSNLYMYANTSNVDPSGAVRFAIEELLDCERRGLKAWVQAHIPIGGISQEALPQQSRLITQMLERFSDNIAGIFFGHTHIDEFTVLYANNATARTFDNALNVAWVAPSVTPYTDFNPSWRWYQVDSDTYEIMDSITNIAVIDQAFDIPWDEAPDLVWQFEYSARDAYGSSWPANEPLNGKFWHLVASQILETGSFAQDFESRSYRYSQRVPDCTGQECRLERYCYTTSFSVEQVNSCYAQWDVSVSKRDAILPAVPTWPMRRPKRHNLVSTK